jgi:hypothetical protein
VDVQASALDISGSLEHECEATLILRHHRWTPPSSAAFVQEIRERVFIVSRVPR